MPTTIPTTRTGCRAVRSPSAKATSAPTIGTHAISSPVNPDGRSRWAFVSSTHGRAISIAAKASTAFQRTRTGRSAPARAASSNSGTAPTKLRPNTITGGAMWPTATLVNRYGTPQIAPIAPNSNQPRRDSALVATGAGWTAAEGALGTGLF